MTARECAICYPRDVECEGECDGKREATHEVAVGVDVIRETAATPWAITPRVTRVRTKPMCHTCAVNERTEKDRGHTDD